ncbi:unnamed protein product [Lactuca virosa]|uniref:Uncharacterized protein n=1 Tax=Lactuca virosa TaxID=75947 RepID=A0AAU9N724_9ASTR|nr:unnamed protein product [Lactuca virosa]
MASSILNPSLTTIYTTLAALASILIVFVIFSFSTQPNCLRTNYVRVRTHDSLLPPDTTNISHLVFGLVGSTNAWHHRKSYIESWWRPNITRGYLYLDTAPTDDLLPWSEASPPFRISDNITTLFEESRHNGEPVMVRLIHAVIEIFRDEREDVRWYIMGDDDSIFFVDNLVDVLSKYDHTKYIYIGGHSESIAPNEILSYDMGFGGAGLIMSYPLAKMVQKNIEDCVRRYPQLKCADQTLMNCVNDFGVTLTAHQGLHQMDLHGDVSGFLSSHPKVPMLSLHHFDQLDPIFPSMDRSESAKHLMKAANIDQPRLVQQTVCYDRQLNWTFSCSWGYSVHIYENIITRSVLKAPLQTFKPWILESTPPLFIFDTRPLSNDPCATPHVFLFESIKIINETEVITNYVRVASRGLPACEIAGNHSADLINRIEVVSPMTKPKQDGKAECCDIVENKMEVVRLKLRDCMEDELIA